MRVVLAFARERLSEQLRIERLAGAAPLSPRQFGRVFREKTGTPAKAIERLRVEAAHLRLQNGSEPVWIIARSRVRRPRANAAGVRDPLRATFKR